MASQSMFEGDVFKLNCGSIATVIKYHNCFNVDIITSSGFHTTSRADHIRDGGVTDLFYPSVYDYGFLGGTTYKPRTIEYYKWSKMIQRCKVIRNGRTSSICEEWLNFQIFAEWHNKESNYKEGWDLDKDLKVPGNKQYKNDTCIYVPNDINSLFHNKIKIRDLPIGIFYGKLGFYCDLSGEKYHFYSKEDAINKYWEIKLVRVRQKIKKYPEFEEILLRYFDYFYEQNFKGATI